MQIEAKDIRSWLSGEVLRSEKLKKQYRLIGLIAFLIFVYIASGYQSMQQQHRLTDLKNEYKDAKFEYLTIAAERAEATRQSEIIKLLEEKGSRLKENRKPVILVD